MTFTDFQLIVAGAVFLYMFFRIWYLKDSIVGLNIDMRFHSTHEHNSDLSIQKLTIERENLAEIIEEYHNKESK